MIVEFFDSNVYFFAVFVLFLWLCVHVGHTGLVREHTKRISKKGWEKGIWSRLFMVTAGLIGLVTCGIFYAQIAIHFEFTSFFELLFLAYLAYHVMFDICLAFLVAYDKVISHYL